MPSACGKSLEEGLTCYLFIQMKRLRVEVLREFAYLISVNRVFLAGKPISNYQIIQKEFFGL